MNQGYVFSQKPRLIAIFALLFCIALSLKATTADMLSVQQEYATMADAMREIGRVSRPAEDLIRRQEDQRVASERRQDVLRGENERFKNEFEESLSNRKKRFTRIITISVITAALTTIGGLLWYWWDT